MPTASSRRSVTIVKSVIKRLLGFWFRFVVDQITSLGVTTAYCLRGVVARIEELERRVGTAEASAVAVQLQVAAPHAVHAIDTWSDELGKLAAGAGGRTLYADERARELVADWQAAGADVYGLEHGGDPFDTSMELRHGDLLAHLAAVGEGALAAVLLAGCTERLDAASLAALVQAVARVLRPGGTVAIASEAPWAWQVRVGPVEADLAKGRPVSADTWLAHLHERGFVATAAYATDGRSYLVIASTA